VPIVDEVLIFDNSDGKNELIAEKLKSNTLEIYSETKFQILKNN
jgi:hypothetical protein